MSERREAVVEMYYMKYQIIIPNTKYQINTKIKLKINK